MLTKTNQPSGIEKQLLSKELSRRFMITVDTEEEFDWDKGFERSGHTTITVPKLERFQEFANKYGIKPVYFVDYSIIEDDAAVAFLQTVVSDKSASIGVHLHPWVNPPFEEEINDYNSFAGNLPFELEEAKILSLREAIEEKTGHHCQSYRAGRYGVGPNTVEILSKHGFRVDSSVRSRFDYRGEGGPDFGNIGSHPFWLGADKQLLELPLTTVFSGLLRTQSGLLTAMTKKSRLLGTLISRTKMLERIPLTPEGISAREAKEAIDVALDDGVDLLVFSFHSPSLSAGHTPYVRTSEDLDKFYDWWRDIIDHLQRSGLSPLGMDELIEKAGSTAA